MKVVFLDIDGVLNSRRSAVAFGRYGTMAWRASAEEVRKQTCLDPVAAALLAKALEATKASVVISSTWRMLVSRGREKEAFDALFEAYNVPQVVIGATPILHDGSRGDEIDAWLRENDGNVESYVILDDNCDMQDNQLSRFVRTNPDVGMTENEMQKIISLLE